MKKLLTLALSLFVTTAAFSQADTFHVTETLTNHGNCKTYVEAFAYDALDTSSSPSPIAMSIDSTLTSGTFTLTLIDTLPAFRNYFLIAIMTHDSTCWCPAPSADSTHGLVGVWLKQFLADSSTHNYFDSTTECYNTTGLPTTDVRKVEIYPNPVKNQLTLNLTTISQVSISTLNGSVIYSGTLQEGHNSIDMSQFSDGLYILYVNNKPYRIVKMN